MKSSQRFLLLIFALLNLSTKADYLGLIDETTVLSNFLYDVTQYIDTFEKESVVTRHNDCFLLNYRPLSKDIQAKLCLTQIQDNKFLHQFFYNGVAVLKTVIVGEFDDSELDDLHFYRFQSLDKLEEFRFINFPFEFRTNFEGSAHLLFDEFKIFVEKTDDSITYYPKCSWCGGWAKANVTDLGIVYSLESAGHEVGPISFYKELDSHINMFAIALSSSLLGYLQQFGLPKTP